jgi:D-cysteine desulfhydrase
VNLVQFPRRRYTVGYTPIERLARLSQVFGGPTIYMKRDDLLGLTGGGNKTRKLEFVVADALACGSDTLITCGAVQSNHCRLTLAAAIREGLKCRLVLQERVAHSYHPEASGNNFLYRLLGAEEIKVVPRGSDMTAEMEEVADRLAAEGRKGYVIPGGASNPIGATGYVACAEEILAQSFDMGVTFDRVICASGSGGTHAGLLAGFHGNNSRIATIGISVSRSREEQEERVWDLARRTADRLGVEGRIARESVLCLDDYVGPGYSLPTPGMVEAVRLLARTEGILLDPVYTGKVMAGLIDLIRKGRFDKGENLLFVHTGGGPALFAYVDAFLGSSDGNG